MEYQAFGTLNIRFRREILTTRYGLRAIIKADASASVGTAINSYENTFAEIFNGFYKYEVIDYLEENWDSINDVGLATLARVGWFNKTRLHNTISYVSFFEFKEQYDDNLILPNIAARYRHYACQVALYQSRWYWAVAYL